MTTFDLTEVRRFADDLSARTDRCEKGEGVECATLDAALAEYASLCCTYRDVVRQWGRAIFSGQAAYDSDVEFALLREGARLYERALEMWNRSQKSAEPCYTLEGRIKLQAALWELRRLLEGWVVPALAIGPSARRGIVEHSASTDEVKKRLASLPPLPADWQPDDPLQQALHRKQQTS